MWSSSHSLAEALGAVLLDPAGVTALPARGRIDAAVLVAICLAEAGPTAIFTRRRHDMRRHAGEISFPGGRRDDCDADLGLTALREAEEEIGLRREEVRLLGALMPVPTVGTSFAVYPFVGLIEPGHTWRPCRSEVDEVLELSLTTLRASRARRRLNHRGIPFRTDVYDVGRQRVIWGATARIVGDLLERLGPGSL